MFVDDERGSGGEVLPGAGLEVDLDRRVCPACGREAPPWEQRCPACDVATVPPEQAPAMQWDLSHLAEDGDDALDRARDAEPGAAGAPGDPDAAG